ncbi:hypothetical protein TNCV_3349081 [Trichonephila clavipes]|nr:hypothetical protein TNCV_3349081 [Trichonephila clavipes]
MARDGGQHEKEAQTGEGGQQERQANQDATWAEPNTKTGRNGQNDKRHGRERTEAGAAKEGNKESEQKQDYWTGERWYLHTGVSKRKSEVSDLPIPHMICRCKAPGIFLKRSLEIVFKFFGFSSSE